MQETRVFTLKTKVFSASFAVNILTWIWIWFRLPKEPTETILHYNVAYGADLVDSSGKIYLIPATATVIFLVNLLLVPVFRRHLIAQNFLAAASLLCSVLLFISSWFLLRYIF